MVSRRRGALVVALLPAVFSLACKKSVTTSSPSPDASAQLAEEPAAKQSADAAPVDDRVSVTKSFTTFRKDELDECIDFTLLAPPGSDPEKVEKAATSTFKTPKSEGRDVIPIKGYCATSVADRTALASCVAEKDIPLDGGVLTMVIAAYYFNVRTTKDSDGYMRDCLKLGGKWTAASKDDPEAARERLRQRAKNLKDIADKMNGAQ